MPYHGQGHLNTMLQFAKRLAWKCNGSIHITLATTLSTSQKMIKSTSGTKMEQFLTTQIIYDDTNDTQLNFLTRMKKFETEATHQLNRVLLTNPTPSLLVYDANLPWALDIAKQYGILAAAFFTQACAYVTSFYPLFVEEYKDDVYHPVIAAANRNCLDHLSIKVPKPEELETGLPNIQVNKS